MDAGAVDPVNEPPREDAFLCSLTRCLLNAELELECTAGTSGSRTSNFVSSFPLSVSERGVYIPMPLDFSVSIFASKTYTMLASRNQPKINQVTETFVPQQTVVNYS